jgi:hypothetical protein
MAETAAYPPFYTLNQQKALVWGPRVTSVLSILGSTIVLYMIYVDRAKKLKRIYHRIIFVWSCFSVLISLMGMLSTLPSPKEGGYYGSLGNTATCTAQGFLWHWAFAATMVYNGILSLCELCSSVLAGSKLRRHRGMPRFLTQITFSVS